MLKPVIRNDTVSGPEAGNSSHPEKELLKKIIAELECDITGHIGNSTRNIATDLSLMPALVNEVNRKYPQMNLRFADTPQTLAVLIKQSVSSEEMCSRYIVNGGENCVHFAIIDCKIINDKISVILFEPATYHNMVPAMLALRVKLAIEREHIPDCCFSAAEMDIQHSRSECGIFSLILAKKIHTESEHLFNIHKDNAEGILSDSFGLVMSDKTDTYLPVTFYKHTQGLSRIEQYIQSHPEDRNRIINKKNETIYTRFVNHSVEYEHKQRSVSAYEKRIALYKSVMK